MKRATRIGLLLATITVAALVLACGSASSGITTGVTPRWACPSPLPQPWGPEGPIKREWQECTIDPITGERTCTTQREYYEIWGQEYGQLHSGPPYPSPTPYALVGTNYTLGQRVEIGPLHLLVDARAGPGVTEPGFAADQQQLYLVELTWVNRATQPVAIDYAQHVLLRAITDQTGAVVTDDRWGMSALALQLSGIEAPPAAIPSGTSQITIPILAPRGEPEIVEVLFEGRAGFFPPLPSSTVLPGTPTSTPPPDATATLIPLPNVGLRAAGDSVLRVQWSRAIWRAPGAAPCGSAGTLTDWANAEGVAWGADVPIAGVIAPPGAARVVQIAVNQIGKRYVWGAKGPESFDCSGLVSWSYAQIGIRIPAGTAGQWPGMAQVASDQLLPGDLVFFDIDQDRRVDHVGMLVGDLNGNGQWDMVHAASPRLGVRMDYDLFTSAYYQPRIVGFRTACTGAVS